MKRIYITLLVLIITVISSIFIYSTKHNSYNPETQKLIHILETHEGCYEIMSLIKSGADSNAKNSHGDTVLMALCKESASFDEIIFENIIDDLLSLKIDINAQNNDGKTALMCLERGLRSYNSVYEIHRSHRIKKLLATGADVNIQDKKGNTALMRAEISFPKFSKLLIASDAHVNTKNNKGNTVLHYISKKWHRFFDLKKWDKDFCIYQDKRDKCMRYLLEAKVDLNAKNNKGRTAFMIAVKSDPEAIKVLAESGADIHAKDNKGCTPLMLAARYNACAIEPLIKAGANIEMEEYDGTGYTALLIAVCHNTSAVEQLLAAGANMKVSGWHPKNRWDWDPVQMAEHYNKSALEPLLKAWTKLDANNEFGAQALSCAMEYKPEFVEPLLKAGADINLLSRI